MNENYRISRILIGLFLTVCFAINGFSQETVPVEEVKLQTDTIRIEVGDSVFLESADSVARAVMKAADSLSLDTSEEVIVKEPFKPNPTKAVIFSAIVPGLGQIYNRQYWKLPILYGGLMGCFYAITWNNKNYSDYTDAYWAVTRPEEDKFLENVDSWLPYMRGSIDSDDREALLAKQKDTNFHNQLKHRRDYFRRFRDMSIFIGVGVYVLGILDAYVDAHLFDFDISPDLSMRVEPVVAPSNGNNPSVYGINCSIKF